jgi:hypothetical protein
MQAIQRIAGLYRIEQEARAMTAPDRLHSRQLRISAHRGRDFRLMVDGISA